MWVIYLVKLTNYVKPMLQIDKECSFYPIWISMCCFKFPFVMKFFCNTCKIEASVLCESSYEHIKNILRTYYENITKAQILRKYFENITKILRNLKITKILRTYYENITKILRKILRTY